MFGAGDTLYLVVVHISFIVAWQRLTALVVCVKLAMVRNVAGQTVAIVVAGLAVVEAVGAEIIYSACGR